MGKRLRWRHLHANTCDKTEGMILHFAADQHRGQAKGLGLHLHNLAQRMPEKYDLHEPEKLLASLNPYKHLHCIFRLCTVHVCRNIHDVRGISDDVRNLMRGLICLNHSNWESMLTQIATLGGKPGAEWVKEKVNSKFAFEGLCWEKSFIPLSIWKAGEANSNLIESVHADVNREGTSCSLLGGIAKGRAFDNLKMKTLLAFETAGIRPSYQMGHLSENITRNLKQKSQAHHNNLLAEDTKICAHNKRIEKARAILAKASSDVNALIQQLQAIGPETHPVQYTRLSSLVGKAR
ncbi:hypothetical protein H0H92_004354 [Tricholoma furcatifolium]|nr:hypothetical protein H0H92_004354 [Tricholoma furcatifolium]